jgi:AraC family ethanolamine operon transcriptional activator
MRIIFEDFSQMTTSPNSQLDLNKDNTHSSLILPKNPQKDCLILKHQFEDIDAWAEVMKPLNLIHRNQLTPGGFLGTINHALLPEVQLTYSTQNQNIHVTGPKPTHVFIFTIAFSSQPTSLLSHGKPIKQWDLFGFDRSRETNVILQKDTQVIMVNVCQQAFLSLGEKMGYENLEEKILKQNIANFHPATIRSLRNYYQQMVQILFNEPSLPMPLPIQSMMREDFLPLLMDTVGAIARQNKTRAKTPHRYSLIRKAEEFMLSHPDKPLTLQNLCESLESSSTALCAGFQEIFGLSPMNYLKIQRLNGVRRALKKANPYTTTVMQLAQQWGFWSLNHFASDYKNMFGELPSETLKKRSGFIGL